MASAAEGNLHFIEGKTDQYVYINIRKQNLRFSAKKFGLEETFRSQNEAMALVQCATTTKNTTLMTRHKPHGTLIETFFKNSQG